MSDYNNPPNGGHPGGPQPGGPQGPYGGPPPNQYGGQQPNQYGGQQPNPYGGQQPGHAGGQPGQYGGQQPGPGPQGQPGPYGQPQQPGPYGPPAGPGPLQFGRPGPQGEPGPGQGQPGTSYSPAETQQFGQPPFGPGGSHPQQWAPEPRRKRRGKLIPIIAALAVLIVFGGGAAFAYSRMAGGGDQPDAVLPGNAVAYARIDLDPGAGQKVAALRFLMKFPSVKDKVGLTSENDDLRRKLFDFIKKESGEDLADVDFDKDVDPWLGDRAGVAAVPGDGDKPDPVIAVQIKDEDKAKAGLDKLFVKADPDDKPGMAFTGDYVILADDQAAADKALAASKDYPLSDNAKFSKDMGDLGEQGFASFWVDMKGIESMAGKELKEQGASSLPEGSAAAALRFDAGFVELKGIVHGDKAIKPGATGAEEIAAGLPDSTAAALAIADGETQVTKVWEQLQKTTQGGDFNLEEMVKGLSDQYGIKVPDDLKVLLGKRFAVALDKEVGSMPKVAIKADTDPAKAEAVADKLLGIVRNQSGADVPVLKAKDDDTLVLATTQEYADQVLKGGNLGDTEAFKQAVPDPKDAVALAYVDLESVLAFAPSGVDSPDAKVLRSVGLVSRITGDGEADFTLRVVAK